MKTLSDRRQFSRTVTRQVDLGRATGALRYASDLYMPEMLIAHVVRSPYAHCSVHKIDTTAAKQVPGVHAVLTHHDILGKKYVGKTRDDLAKRMERSFECICWYHMRPFPLGLAGETYAAEAAWTPC